MSNPERHRPYGRLRNLAKGLGPAAMTAGAVSLERGRELRIARLRAAARDRIAGLDPAPLVIEASATPTGLQRAIGVTAPDDICSSLGGLYAHGRIPVGLMFGRNATLKILRDHAEGNAIKTVLVES